MKLYHTSPNKIEKIKKTGLFGECLCFSSSVYSMSVGEVLVYSIEIEDSEIIEVSRFDSDDAPNAIAHIAHVLDCSEDDALDYLTGSEIHSDAEMDWFIQGMMGEAAKEAGYKAASSRDEQGTVYIVPMFGKESELVLA